MNQLIVLHIECRLAWPFSQNICNQIFSFAFCSTQKVWHFCLKRTNKKRNITNISFHFIRSDCMVEKGLRFVFHARILSLLLSFRIATRRKGKEAGVRQCECVYLHHKEMEYTVLMDFTQFSLHVNKCISIRTDLHRHTSTLYNVHP